MRAELRRLLTKLIWNKMVSIFAEVGRRLSFVREVETKVDANLKRAEGLGQAIRRMSFAAGALAAQ
jgi:hypothetical protein